MPEFQFKNLTIKLGDDDPVKLKLPCGTLCSVAVSCYHWVSFPPPPPPPTIWCVRFPTNWCLRECSVLFSLPPCKCSAFPSIPHTPGCGITELPWEREELELLQEQVKLVQLEIEERQAKIGSALPASVGEVDELKKQLLDAVAELDEQRSRLTEGTAE